MEGVGLSMHKLFVEMIKSVMLNNYNVIPTYSFALNIFYSKYFKRLVSYKERR